MGHVKIDIEAKSRTYSATYALNTAAGVKAILRDRHKIAEQRYRGDTDASAILIDLHSAIESAGLTERQAEAIAWVYGLDMTHAEASEIMCMSRPAITQFTDEAAERIATIFRKWEYGEVSVEINEGEAD